MQLWGAQWWKANDVTAARPPSFKGWATTVDLDDVHVHHASGQQPAAA